MRFTVFERPLVVVLVGPTAAGKSVLAGMLREQFPLVVVSNDELRATFFPRPTYQPEESAKVYLIATERIQAAVLDGNNVVYDGTNGSQIWRNKLEKMIETVADLVYVVLSAPEEVFKARLQRREARTTEFPPQGRPWWDVYVELCKRMEPLNHPHLIADSTAPFDELVKLLGRLGLAPRAFISDES
jgi:predicted kinase